MHATLVAQASVRVIPPPALSCAQLQTHAEQRSKVLREIQAYEEMFEWLEEEYNVASDAFDQAAGQTPLTLQALQPQPTLEIARGKHQLTCKRRALHDEVAGALSRRLHCIDSELRQLYLQFTPCSTKRHHCSLHQIHKRLVLC